VCVFADSLEQDNAALVVLSDAREVEKGAQCSLRLYLSLSLALVKVMLYIACLKTEFYKQAPEITCD
jgi:hypothetical protein